MRVCGCVTQGENIAECTSDQMSSSWFSGTTDERYVIWFYRDPSNNCDWKTHDRYSTNNVYNLKQKLAQTMSTLVDMSKACITADDKPQKSDANTAKKPEATSEDKSDDDVNDTKKLESNEGKDEKPKSNDDKAPKSDADVPKKPEATSEDKSDDDVNDTKKFESNEGKDEKPKATDKKPKSTLPPIPDAKRGGGGGGLAILSDNACVVVRSRDILLINIFNCFVKQYDV